MNPNATPGQQLPMSSAEPAPAVGGEPAGGSGTGSIGVVLLFCAAFVTCLAVYLAYTVPGAWFPAAPPRAWAAENLALAKGTGGVSGDELVVTAPDPSGVTIVSVVVRIRSSDYAAIAWAAIDIPEQADVRLLWQSDYAPGRIMSTPIRIEAGRPTPTLVRGNRDWLGNITGLALTITSPLPQPVRIRGMAAKPMGVLEILGDRIREWLALERWTGTSINTIVGGADIQDLPLPLLTACAIALAAAIAYLRQRYRPQPLSMRFPVVLAALFVAGSLLLDLRWTWNLARQLKSTAAQYAGLDARGRYLASDDAPLYAFVEKARALLPAKPARVFIVADAAYFRGRAAYHLYPQNVFFDPINNTMPPASALHPGDWLVVFQRRGIQYSPAEQRLRWDGGPAIAAELKLVDPLGAVFLVR